MLLALVALIAAAPAPRQDAPWILLERAPRAPLLAGARWIWAAAEGPGHDRARGVVELRRRFELEDRGPLAAAALTVACEEAFQALLDGEPVGAGADARRARRFELAARLAPGTHELVVRAREPSRGSSRPGIALALELEWADGGRLRIESDALWQARALPAAAEAQPASPTEAWVAAEVGARFGEHPTDAEIAPPSSALAGRWYALRRSFELERAPKSARARIAADSKYWLWIDGQMVVFEGGLKRGPAPGAGYVDEVELAPFLHAGANVLAVLVRYFGKDGFSHQDSGAPGFAFELALEEGVLESDGRWRARQHPAYVPATGGTRPNFRLSESNVRFDARADLGDWTAPGYDDSDWPAATPAETDVWGALEPRLIPLWRDGGVRPFPDPPELPRVSDGEVLELALPYDGQFTPWFRVDAPAELAGALVDLRTDHHLEGGAPNVRAEYVLRAGVQEHESLGWMNGHAMRFTFPAGTRVLALGVRETGYDADFVPGLVTGDAFLDRYGEKARRTLYLCLRDGFMDCPDRERAQWWGDVVLQMGQLPYVLDPRALELAGKALRELAAWRRPDGALFSPVPSGSWSRELPVQMLASVGRYGIWTYWMHSGDRETVERAYPAARDYVLDLWRLRERGARGESLVEPRAGDWLWADWGANQDLPLLLDGWYALALEGIERLAQLLGDEPARLEARARGARIRAHFHDAFWRAEEGCYRSDGHVGPPDERGHALAVLAGLAPRALGAELRAVLVSQRHAGQFMERFVLEALFELGHPDDALERLRARYAPMVAHPSTTLWEDWEIGGAGGGTRNHAWAGGAHELLAARAVGLRPIEPAWRAFEIEPRLGVLERPRLAIETLAGRVAVELERAGARLEARVDVPAGARGELVLCEPVEVEVERAQVLQAASRGDAELRAEGARLRVVLPPGQWRVLCSGRGLLRSCRPMEPLEPESR